MSNVIFKTACQLAQDIQDKRLSAMEVLEEHLEHIEKHNPILNAVVTLNEEKARERAREADLATERGERWGPLHGVPVTIKDSFETEGLRTTSSFKLLSGHIPTQDATVVRKLRAGGAIILGKTNLPELAMDLQTNSPVFGRANNPWNTNRTPGGSTGGGAAAVSAGLSPLEIGSDAAGSARIPAHFCGVFSIKPTEHRVSMAGHIPGLPKAPVGLRHMVCPSIVARSIEDLELALTIVSGPDKRQWEVPPVPAVKVDTRPLSELRMAWMDSFDSLPVSLETREALSDAADKLARSGCPIEKKIPSGFDFDTARKLYALLFASEIGSEMSLLPRLLTRLGFAIMGRGDRLLRPLLKGFKLDMRRYVKALTERDETIRALEDFLEDFDALICPVTLVPAFSHRKTGKPIQVDERTVPYFSAIVSYTCVFNLTGSPVVVVPIGLSKDGLPIGMQLVGRRWHDFELLSVAKKIAATQEQLPRPPGF